MRSFIKFFFSLKARLYLILLNIILKHILSNIKIEFKNFIIKKLKKIL